MKKIVFIALLSLLFFCTCKRDLRNLQSFESLKMVIDTFQIKINSNCLPVYHKSYVAIIDSSEIFIGYNRFLHSFDLFNLDEGCFYKQVLLEKRGPNGIPDIGQFVVCNNRFIISAIPYYIILDFNGLVLNKINPSELLVKNNIQGYTFKRGLFIENTNSLGYNCENESMLVPVYPTFQKNDPFYYTNSFMALINFRDVSLNIIDLPFPEIFQTKKFYGNLDHPNFLLIKNSILFNFRNSSNIYTYNLNSGNLQIYNVLSHFTNNESSPIGIESISDLKQTIRHEATSLQFHPIKYDPYKNMYYRVHNDKAPEGKMLISAKSYLTLINNNLEKISEHILPDFLYQIYDITSRGILFQTKESHIDDFENLALYMVTFKE